MRVVIVGGAGMLGHRLWFEFRERFDAFVTLRQPLSFYADLDLFARDRTFDGVDALEDPALARVLDKVRPDVVVNAVGIIKQLKQAHDGEASIAINALLPHRLARLANERGAKLLHVSTDCVFSGKQGHYTECDTPDATDLYGRSKLLGEVTTERALTVRTSMIGRELGTHAGLVEWFLGNRGGAVKGYKRAIFSGFTTHALARVLGDIIEKHPDLFGLWHVSAEPITKFALLELVNQAFAAGIRIEPDESFECDRSLDSVAYRDRTGFRPMAWDAMVAEMASDERVYSRTMGR